MKTQIGLTEKQWRKIALSRAEYALEWGRSHGNEGVVSDARCLMRWLGQPPYMTQ